MRRVLLIDAIQSHVLSIEGRLRAMNGVSAVRRTGDDGSGLAVLADVEDAEAFRRLVENRIKLLTGVQGCRTLSPGDAALAVQAF